MTMGLHQSNSNSASYVGCFNCGRQVCYVATCPRTRDPDIIAKNIGRWKELRKLDKSAKININTVPPASAIQCEAKEEMVAAVLVIQYQNTEADDSPELEHATDPLVHLNETLQNNVLDHMSAAQMEEMDVNDQADGFEINMSSVTSPDACEWKYITIHRSQLTSSNPGSSTTNQRCSKSEFIGACLDTGAQRSMCGLNQAIAYDTLHPGWLSEHETAIKFKFGEQVAKSIGKIQIKFRIDQHNHLDLMIDVVHVDIPLIIGLDILRSRKLLVNYVHNTLIYCNEKVNRPITFKYGHVFVEWDQSEILFTSEELTRFHLHFMHPFTSRLLQLIPRSDPTKANCNVIFTV